MSTAFPPSSLLPLLTQIHQHLLRHNQTLSIIETACGGLLSSSLLSLPSTSKIYRGALTLYTLPSRLKFGGWTAADIQTYRGPTPDIVAGLARHVQAELESTYALAESGTAGPTGGNTRNRTPGYVALAVVGPGGKVRTKEVETGLGGDRVGNMVRFAEEALVLLRDVLLEDVKGEGEGKGEEEKGEKL